MVNDCLCDSTRQANGQIVRDQLAGGEILGKQNNLVSVPAGRISGLMAQMLTPFSYLAAPLSADCLARDDASERRGGPVLAVPQNRRQDPAASRYV